MTDQAEDQSEADESEDQDEEEEEFLDDQTHILYPRVLIDPRTRTQHFVFVNSIPHMSLDITREPESLNLVAKYVLNPPSAQSWQTDMPEPDNQVIDFCVPETTSFFESEREVIFNVPAPSNTEKLVVNTVGQFKVVSFVQHAAGVGDDGLIHL